MKMSNDENNNESVDKSEELVDKLKETASEVVENIEETVDEVIDNIEETVDEAVDTASDIKDNVVSKAMALKESNPKVFFGGLGILALVVLSLLMSGGSDKKPLPAPRNVNLSVGQTYELKGVNNVDPDATVRLVSVPGSMAAYDDTEEKDRTSTCLHMPQQTKVKLKQLQVVTGAKYAQVEMIEGNCAGKTGWVISNNLN